MNQNKSHLAEIKKNLFTFDKSSKHVKFFKYTDKGLPRFPKCVGIRLDK